MSRPDIGSEHTDIESGDRQSAVERLRAKRDLSTHLVAYVVVNAGLVAVWALTGAGYFWPAWVIGGWGIGLLLHAWEIYGRRPITDEDIRREIAKHGRDG